MNTEALNMLADFSKNNPEHSGFVSKLTKILAEEPKNSDDFFFNIRCLMKGPDKATYGWNAAYAWEQVLDTRFPVQRLASEFGRAYRDAEQVLYGHPVGWLKLDKEVQQKLLDLKDRSDKAFKAYTTARDDWSSYTAAQRKYLTESDAWARYTFNAACTQAGVESNI